MNNVLICCIENCSCYNPSYISYKKHYLFINTTSCFLPIFFILGVSYSRLIISCYTYLEFRIVCFSKIYSILRFCIHETIMVAGNLIIILSIIYVTIFISSSLTEAKMQIKYTLLITTISALCQICFYLWRYFLSLIY